MVFDKNHICVLPLFGSVLILGVVLYIFLSFSPSVDAQGMSQYLPDEPRYLYVGGTGVLNYSHIQEALDDAERGDIIFVYRGDYYEDIVIHTPVILQGEERNKTILHGVGSGNIIQVTGGNVTLHNFTIQAGGMTHGGVILNSSDNMITQCTITNNLFGVYAEQVKNNSISRCTFSFNSNGLLFDKSCNNTVSYCTIIQNNEGVVLDTDSNYNIISRCTFQNNTMGMFLWGLSNYNTITYCIFSQNTYGIRLWDAKMNNFYLNTFSDNVNHTDSVISDNIWYSLEKINYTFNGSPRWGYVGNQWDDYRGTDGDGDGIGDIPYEIDADDDDNYPLMTPDKGNGIPGFDLVFLIAGFLVVLGIYVRKKHAM